MHFPKAKLPFYPPYDVKYRLQNGVSTARYFVQKTETAVIYKTTHQSGLRKHPKDTFLVQMRAEQKKERKASKRFLLFRLRVLNAIVIKNNCLYTHTKSHRQRETKKKADYHNQHISKLLITKNTQYVFDFYNFLQLYNTIALEKT